MEPNYEAVAETGKKKKSKLPIVTVIIIIVCVVIGVGASIGVRTYNNAQRLAINDEITAINQIIDVDYYENVDRDALYSHLNNRVAGGKYADVENASKEYIIDFHDDVFDTVDKINDDRLINALSAENLAADGPELTETKEYIAQLKAEVEAAKASCIEKSSAEAIASYAEKYGLKGETLDFYNEIMNISENTESTSEYINSLDKIINNLNTVEAALNLLSENPDSWEVEGDTVYFSTQSLLDEYNAICAEISE